MYDEYMQNLMGVDYSPYSNTYDPYERNQQYFNQIDNYEQYNYPYSQAMPYNYQHRNSIVADLDNLYPEIYKIIYPMVKRAIDKNVKPISDDVLDDLTNEIYHHLEAENFININVNVNSKNSVDASGSNSENNRVDSNDVENRASRQRNNPVMDLIKILLIRELNERPGYWRPRPPRPMPHRPPFLQRPGAPGNPPPPPPRPMF